LNKFGIITPVPNVIEILIQNSILRKAIKKKVVDIKIINLRDYGIGNYKQIDDAPFGGGGGMVLMPEPLFNAIDYAMNWMKNSKDIRVVLPSPIGEKWNQKAAEKLSKKKRLF